MKIAAVIFVLMCSMFAAEKPRIFVTESDSWQYVGGRGGARPQTAEIIKTLNQSCPETAVATTNRDKADYILTLEHEGGKGLLHRRNKVVLSNKDGDVIYTDSTRSVGNAVKDVCQAIAKESSHAK